MEKKYIELTQLLKKKESIIEECKNFYYYLKFDLIFFQISN
jgi:cell division protein FtsB